MEDGQISERIGALPLLSALDADARRQVANVFLDVADVLHYNDGEPLITQGFLSFGTGYVLLEGKAAVERDGAEPVEVQAPALLGEMAQFRSSDTRSATVRARGAAVAAQFYWDDLYTRAEQSMPEPAHVAFRNAVEAQTWERFEFKQITNIGLFADLSEALRLKVCQPFPTLAERLQLKEVDTLFNQGSLCKNTGHLLVSGEVKLFRKDGGERTCTAPDLLGIFPNKNEKGLEWSATAMPKGQAEVFKFGWDQYADQLVKRLTPQEQREYVASLKNNAPKHFWH